MIKRLICKLLGHKWTLLAPSSEWQRHLYDLGYRKYQCECCGDIEVKHVEELRG